MINDIIFVIRRWQVIHLLGISRLRERYARSKLGQFWLTFSNLFFILISGVVWSVIWKMEVDEYLPYVGVGHVVFLYISQTLNDSTGIFIVDARYYLNERIPFMTSVFAHVYRNTLIFLHNIPLIVILVLWSKSATCKLDLVFFISILDFFIFVILGSYVLAIISSRFRDLIQLFGLIFQLAFLVTPVMWKLSFIPEQYHLYCMLNPLAAFLEIFRNPIIGLPVVHWAYVSALIWTLLLIPIAFILHKKLDRQIIFWI